MPSTALPPQVHEELVQDIIKSFPTYETWLTSKLQWNEPNLRRRLKDLFKRAGGCLRIGKREMARLIGVTVETRNYLVHLDPDNWKKAAEGRELFDLGETLTALMEALLLKDMGFPDEDTEKLLGNVKGPRGRRHGEVKSGA
jgi:hypothetical protein